MFEMSSHDKRHGSHRGGMQGPYRYADVFSDPNFMDETDREVSSLTDRAFRSLCIGEEAIYNDSELASSPTERHKAFVEEVQYDETLKRTAQETLSLSGEQYGEVARTSAVAATFQHSVTDATKQEHALVGDCMSHRSNGVIETTWQQKRSSSKVSSLIKAFNAAEYEGNGGVTTDAPLSSQGIISQEYMYSESKQSWDNSALLSIQNELSEFSSVYHQSSKGSPFHQTRNRFHSSHMAPHMDSTVAPPKFLKGSTCSKFKTPSTQNFFLHSEFSPFQTWKEYNRLQFQSEPVPDILSTNQFPRWYDSPFYKELTAAHRSQMAQLEEKRSHRRQAEIFGPADVPAATVHQKASAIEKRCESELAANCPPWKTTREPVKNKFPPNRPCTASPFSDKSRRREDGLFSSGRSSAIHHKVQTVMDESMSNSGTPFSISQLLTPVIQPRQETETSEILQYALSPTSLDLPTSLETEPKTAPEVKPRNKYKAMASSLLFNLKDNRKRVKSTYTPTMFKSQEIADHSKQPSQLDSLIAKEGAVTSETPLSWASASVWPNGKDLHSVSSPDTQLGNTHTVNYMKRAESRQSDDYLTLISPQTVKEGSNNRSLSNTMQESVQLKDKLAETQSVRYSESPFMASKSNENQLRRRPDYSSWKAYETGSLQAQDRKNVVPDTQAPAQSYFRKEKDSAGKEARDYTKRDVPTSKATGYVGTAWTGQQYDYKQNEEVHINHTNKEMFTYNEKSVARTEKFAMIGDIAALLEKDRQLHTAQRGDPDKQDALATKEMYNKNGLFASAEKGNSKHENANDQAKHEVLAKRQNFIPLGEGANTRQEHRFNHELYEVRESNPTSQGVHLARGTTHNTSEAFARTAHANVKQEMQVTKENKLVKDGEFTVKQYEQARHSIPSRTGERGDSNYVSGFKQHGRTNPITDNKLQKCEVFAITDKNPSRQVQVARENIYGKSNLVSEAPDQVKHGPHSARDVRYAPIEEFARKDRELEQQKINATREVKLQELTKENTHLMVGNRNDTNDVVMIGEPKEAKREGEQVKNMSDTVSAKVPVQTNENVVRATEDRTTKSDVSKVGSIVSAIENLQRSDKDELALRQNKYSQNEAFLYKEKDRSKSQMFTPKERGQTRQEILTSKLKAHAEKEIFAIKEKGHAKWETHATKQKESCMYVHGNKEVELPSIEDIKKDTTNSGIQQARQESATVKEELRKNEPVVNQEASSNVSLADSENWQAKLGMAREKEHSRNSVTAKTGGVLFRQEELQSIARAKIEAIALHKSHKTKPEFSKRDRGKGLSPGSVREGPVHYQLRVEDPKNSEIDAVKESDRVEKEAVPVRAVVALNQTTEVSENHQTKNVNLSEEEGNVSQVSGSSVGHANESEAAHSDVDVTKAVGIEQLIPTTVEHVRNTTKAHHEKHEYEEGTLVSTEKEHACNKVHVNEERVSVKHQGSPSTEQIRSDIISDNKIHPDAEIVVSAKKECAENETSTSHENNQVKLDPPESIKNENDENCALESSEREIPPETDTGAEGTGKSHMHGPEPAGLGTGNHTELENKQNMEDETTAAIENFVAILRADATQVTGADKNDELAEEKGASLSKEIFPSVQHGTEDIAGQEGEDNRLGEKELHISSNLLLNKVEGGGEEELPSVEHIKIKIIAPDETHHIAERVITIGNDPDVKETVESDSDQVKVDFVASTYNKSVESSGRRSTEKSNVKQDELSVVTDKSEVSAVRKSPLPKHEHANVDRDSGMKEIPQLTEKENTRDEVTAVNGNQLEKPETDATRDTEVTRNDVCEEEERLEPDRESPIVELIRIKIIPHNTRQPIRESVFAIENERVASHDNHHVKQDSLASGQSKIPENNSIGSPRRDNVRQEELPPVTHSIAEDAEVNQMLEAKHEFENKDRGSELPCSMEIKNPTENVTTAVDECNLAKSEPVPTQETKDDESNALANKDRMGVQKDLPLPLEHITKKDIADHNLHDHKQGIPVPAEAGHTSNDVLSRKERVPFRQEKPLVEHAGIKTIASSGKDQVRESTVPVGKNQDKNETQENRQIKPDNLAQGKNEDVHIHAFGSTETISVKQEDCPSQTKSESSTVNKNHWFDEVLAKTDKSSAMNENPHSREKEIIKNEMDELNRLPKEVVATRETTDTETDKLAMKDKKILAQEVPPSVANVKKESLDVNEHYAVKPDLHAVRVKEYTKYDLNKETVQNDKKENIEKSKDRGEHLSSAHLESEAVRVKARHQPKLELSTNNMNIDKPGTKKPRKGEITEEEIVSGNENHKQEVQKEKGIEQEVLPDRKTEENVPANRKAVRVNQESKEHAQIEISPVHETRPIKHDMSARMIEPPGKDTYTSKEKANVHREKVPLAPHTGSTTVSERHQTIQEFANRDRANTIHKNVPLVGSENLENKTGTVNENSPTRQEVNLAREKVTKNEMLMLNKGRDELKIQALSLKEKEQNIIIPADETHQAMLATRISKDGSESLLKIKGAMDESMAEKESHLQKEEVQATRDRGHAQNETVSFDENLQVKLDALARRRKEKAEKYVRASMDGINIKQGDHPSTAYTKSETDTTDSSHLAKHGLKMEDGGRIKREIPPSGRNNENLNVKVEARVAKENDYSKNTALANKEAAGVGHRELLSRDMIGVTGHQVQHVLHKKQKGSISQAALTTENTRNEHISGSEHYRDKRQASIMSQKEGTGNYGFENKEGDGVESTQVGMTERHTHQRVKLGSLQTQVKSDSGREQYTSTDRIKEKSDASPSGESRNDNKQVSENEKGSTRRETGAHHGEYAKREVFSVEKGASRKNEVPIKEKEPTVHEFKVKGNTTLDYLMEKDREAIKSKEYAAREKGTVKQEVQAAIPHAKQATLIKEKDLVRNEGPAVKGRVDSTFSNIATRHIDDTRKEEHAAHELQSVKPSVIRKYEDTTESIFAKAEKHQTKQTANEGKETTKGELVVQKHDNLNRNAQEHARHGASNIQAKQETKVASKQETPIPKEREHIRKDFFAIKGRDEIVVGIPSIKRSDTKNKESTDEERTTVKRDVPRGKHQSLSEKVFTVRQDISKQVRGTTEENEHNKQELMTAKADAKQVVLGAKGNVHTKPEVLLTQERHHTNPEEYAVTEKGKQSGKEVLSSHRQGYYGKHVAFASDDRYSSVGDNFGPRGSGKDKSEALSNKKGEITEKPSLREKGETISMTEQRTKERGPARQQQQHYSQEAPPIHQNPSSAAPMTKEKSNTRYEVPVTFENNNTKKEEINANNPQNRMEVAAGDQPNQNIEHRRIREPHSQPIAPTLPLQVNGRREASNFSRQPTHVHLPLKQSYLSVGDAPQSPEEDSNVPPPLGNVQNPKVKGTEERSTEEVKRDLGKLEALQYYAISNKESKADTGDKATGSSQRHERTQRKEEGGFSHKDLNEGSWAHSMIDHAKAHTPTPRSNTSSPSMGKPILFKVKDNTFRASPVTKTVKPRFHKTLTDEIRTGSSRESLSGSEKGDEEHDRQNESREVPVFHSSAAVSSRMPLPRIQRAHSALPTTEFASARTYYRRNQHMDDDERNSVFSAMSEDLDSVAASIAGLAEERLATAMYMEDPCERPESACSDMRPLGKPPSVPPKSEKALRRAKKLTTRRIKKAEARTNVDSPSVEQKPLRAIASMPSSPTEVVLAHRTVHAPVPPPQYRVEPSYAPPSPSTVEPSYAPPDPSTVEPSYAPPAPSTVEPSYVPQAPSLVAQPFPITQRKLLQDPNSGQYFVVDMPVQVKTKMFYDPETGKYVQLSVRQSPEGRLPNAPPMEVLSPPPYMLYPGFLPMPVSSLPPLRSASQMSAPASLMEDQEKCSASWRQEAYQKSHSRESQPYIEPAYASHEQPGEKSSYHNEKGSTSPRNLDIIPMSELEDFAMEST